jgi:hypothetical protein
MSAFIETSSIIMLCPENTEYNLHATYILIMFRANDLTNHKSGFLINWQGLLAVYSHIGP